MPYLVAADGPDLEARVSRRFGHAAHHLLVSAQADEAVVLDGGVHESPRHGLDRFRDEDVEGVVAGNVGPHAFEDIRERGWQVYIVRGVSVREAVQAVVQGEVDPAGGPTMKRSVGDHAGHGEGHGQGGGKRRG